MRIRAALALRPAPWLALTLALAAMESAGSAAAFLERNAADSLPAGGLEAKLESASGEGRQLRVKLGLDPTAPDIHLGHTVVLQKLREFQDAGHRVVLIVGDYTARVGDPSGQSETRPSLTEGEIEANARTYEEQAFAVLDRDPARYELRFNGEWLDMPMADLFALARTTTVAQVLDREDFSERYRSGTPISLLELLYPLLQAYDSVAVDADVEIGGTDQTFNLLLGREVQRAYGRPEQVVLTLPILPGIDGTEKMSKTKGNAISLTDPPEEMYGRTMRLPDQAMDTWFELLAIEDPGGDPRERKRALARSIASRFHGDEAADGAQDAFDRQFVEHEVPLDIQEATFEPDGETVHLPGVLAGAFGISRSEARRLIGQGGVRIDGVPTDPSGLDLPPATLDGKVVQLGRRQFRRLRAKPR